LRIERLSPYLAALRPTSRWERSEEESARGLKNVVIHKTGLCLIVGEAGRLPYRGYNTLIQPRLQYVASEDPECVLVDRRL
jgi:citrate synthase